MARGRPPCFWQAWRRHQETPGPLAPSYSALLLRERKKGAPLCPSDSSITDFFLTQPLNFLGGSRLHSGREKRTLCSRVYQFISFYLKVYISVKTAQQYSKINNVKRAEASIGSSACFRQNKHPMNSDLPCCSPLHSHRVPGMNT